MRRKINESTTTPKRRHHIDRDVTYMRDGAFADETLIQVYECVIMLPENLNALLYTLYYMLYILTKLFGAIDITIIFFCIC